MDSSILLKAERHLRRNDPVMAQLIKAHQPFPLLETLQESQQNALKKPNHYHALIKTIINQQLSVKAAKTILQRLLVKQGGKAFNAKKLQTFSDDTIRSCGISKNKTRYIRSITQAVISKELNFTKLAKQEDDIIIASLTKYPGIGQWSAEMFLITSFNRLDILPLGDLIIRKSIQKHYQLDINISYDKYLDIAAAWRPYRTIASQYLWASAN